MHMLANPLFVEIGPSGSKKWAQTDGRPAAWIGDDLANHTASFELHHKPYEHSKLARLVHLQLFLDGDAGRTLDGPNRADFGREASVE